MNKIKVAIVGASGYSGEELVRLLLRHPHVELLAVTSRQQAGQSLAKAFPKFAYSSSLEFTNPDVEQIKGKVQVAFLALPHGVSAEFAVPLVNAGVKVIDLSADFRLRDAKVYQEFYQHEHPAPDWLPKAVYGLPEFYREQIMKSPLIASPGCYPTSILLPLIPLLRAGAARSDSIAVTSMSGVSGAGRKAEIDYLFTECNESVRPYGVPKHRHLSEIEQELSIAAGKPVMINFTPHLIPINRGILSTIYFESDPQWKSAKNFSNAVEMEKELLSIWQKAYQSAPFVRVLKDRLPDTKHVANTNFADMALKVDSRTGRIIAMCAEDNLLKGAAGQAVQSMNLMFGFEETTGLM